HSEADAERVCHSEADAERACHSEGDAFPVEEPGSQGGDNSRSLAAARDDKVRMMRRSLAAARDDKVRMMRRSLAAARDDKVRMMSRSLAAARDDKVRMTSRRRLRKDLSERALGTLLLLPATLLLLVIVVYPVATLFWNSLHAVDNANPAAAETFVALSNYTRAFDDERFW